jgi:quercetin dioxygenase-like cupin family protein
MLLVETIAGVGDLVVFMYTFEDAGDVLPKHDHDEDTAHITIVARGKIKVRGEDWLIEAVPGQLVNFPAHQPHEIVALEPSTRIFNIVKKFGGQVNDAAQP